jgi:hypothetical protein
MKQRSLASKLVATLLVVALQGLILPLMAAEPGAKVNGSILSSRDDAPLAGAKLHLGDPRTGEVYSSGLSQTDGSFSIDSVPASTYEVAVESDGGLYVVDTPVKLAPGQTQSLNVAIDPQVSPSPEDVDSKKKNRGGTSVWNNPGTAALIVLGGAIVLGWIINEATDDDDEQPASPSNP